MSTSASADLGGLSLGGGGHLLLRRALTKVEPGERVTVTNGNETLHVDLPAWCRAEGHVLRGNEVEKGTANRWAGAERAGTASTPSADAPPTWGLAARGARVEAGGPHFSYPLHERHEVWSDDAARLYAQAAAAQWDPAKAIPWSETPKLEAEVEDAVVQVMTYLVENETAALQVPAAFVARLHPHFREVMQLLAVQAADEARHIEVFTRRALLVRSEPGLSTAGGQASLKTLLDEPDFALASCLLSVLGEGSFLSLLQFLRENAPDAVTREVTKLAAQDEARHVAFGLSHLQRHASHDASLRGRLASAVEQRHRALAHTAGLNAEVFDALVLLAAGSWEPAAIAAGFRRVQALERDMHEGRAMRLERLGFPRAEAERLASLHTRNFM
ncbi:MAG: hypothetical protein JNK82_32330 [Myxococcaceae bacterium]|nr:hypothetical protein [Myxococcaceae bacterium]